MTLLGRSRDQRTPQMFSPQEVRTGACILQKTRRREFLRQMLWRLKKTRRICRIRTPMTDRAKTLLQRIMTQVLLPNLSRVEIQYVTHHTKKAFGECLLASMLRPQTSTKPPSKSQVVLAKRAESIAQYMTAAWFWRAQRQPIVNIPPDTMSTMLGEIFRCWLPLLSERKSNNADLVLY